MCREEARWLHVRTRPWSGSVKPSPVALLDGRDGPKDTSISGASLPPLGSAALGIESAGNTCVSAGVLRRSGKGKRQAVKENTYMASLESSSWPLPVQLSITGSAENARQRSENTGVQESPVLMESLV